MKQLRLKFNLYYIYVICSLFVSFGSIDIDVLWPLLCMW